jgi:ferredoxin-NADP reductase
MDKPVLVKGKILTKSLLTEDVVRLKIKNIEPMETPYKIGQYINLKISPGVYRSYSIFNYDENIHAFEIAAKVAHSGPGANYIKSISAGSDVEYVGPAGKFNIGTEAENVYLFATGTGITPFLAYLRYLDNSFVKPAVKLFWGLREKKDVFMEDIIYSYKMSIPKFDYQIYLSQENGSFQYESGHVTDAIAELDVEDDAEVYLCGNPHMVADAKQMLQEKGVSQEQIFFEKYTWAEGEDSDDDFSEGQIVED